MLLLILIMIGLGYTLNKAPFYIKEKLINPNKDLTWIGIPTFIVFVSNLPSLIIFFLCFYFVLYNKNKNFKVEYLFLVPFIIVLTGCAGYLLWILFKTLLNLI